MRGVRVLMAATIGMGVLIVLGVVVLAVTVVQRSSGNGAAPAANITLAQPPGTRIAGAAMASPDRMLVQLGGGGPDRVVVVDLKTGRIAATIGLAP